ncbi:heavy metal translocating P-type ATPase [Stutzerimonas stutzeri]|uniref:P-type Zn(2+) transporter n=5 Tax=Pseudomonadota TaxID=1224 RepID=A0ABY7MZ59_ALCFA|nr:MULTISPECIES: heavy metal translocating P-type ATPase [Pseudomonadota]MBS0511721.1 cadmium-translocating P-type ATPase [Pseudomonadota bacterium]EKU2826491.1 cadmium-translocating P-type ATPase [Pseudomonas aeruginosa]EKU5147662.1 cadmium-translocating P-type ATPase [Pseudomonas aeruginosa]EKU5152574.1 cadmium-translocating P-type ATPase [Pseudomonas aeruginosa]EKW4393793.1 cadmium-translocating P-type ATPase [Pseudomonas aeruginosa]
MSLETLDGTGAQDEQLGFRVEGMDCASCVGKIETALGRIDGVSNVQVNFTNETLTLTRSTSSRNTARDIAKKIRSLGFDVQALPASEMSAAPAPCHAAHAHDHAGCGGHHDHGHAHDHGHDHSHGKACGDDHGHGHAHGHAHAHDHGHDHGACSGHDHAPASASRGAPSTPPNVSMRVEGMDCASCVGKIETALARMDGVSDARINFTAETLELTLASGGPTQLGHIEKTIKSLGFGVSDVRRHDGSAPAAPAAASTARHQRWWQTKKGKHVLGLGGLMGSAYAIAQFVPGYAEWIFAAAVIAGVLPFARKAFALAVSGSPFSIETLMVVASLGALVIGEAEEAAAVVFLFAIGELLESVAAGRARAGIKALASLVPKTAVLLDAAGGQREVPAASLRVSDRVLVRPGDRVPADGKILRGESSLDESPITGESVPRQKAIGADVFAGSINVDGVLEVQVEKTASDNTISRIIQLVEQAQSSKAPTARFIEKFSRYYTPAVMAIAALIVVVPPLAMGGDWGTWLYRGLALLLIACPCALVLSTPAAIASGLAVATRRGLLIKGGNALETIGRVRAIAFDKTGTLTEGKPRITEVLPFGLFKHQQVLALAAAVESGSNHPLAKAIVAHAKSLDVAIPQATGASAIAGKAVRATVNGSALAVGSPAHAEQTATLTAAHRREIDKLEDGGKTVVVLFDEASKNVLGLLALRDEPRRDAREGVAQLNAMGVRSVMLTGDNRRTAQAIAGKLGIEWEAELLPQDKLRLVNEMKRDAKVAMVGDGINDAPALATADVGIAMGGGTDVALETADAALLKSRVTDVAHLVALSRATMANIHQNVVFAIGLKGLFLVTTVLGITGLWVAVLADTGATALVTLNALRLLRFKGAPEANHGDDAGRPTTLPVPSAR